MLLLYAESRYCIHNGIYEKGCALLDRLLQRENALHDTAMLIKTHLQYIYYGVQIYRTDIIEQHLQLGMTLLGDDVCAELAIYLRLSGLHKLMLGRYEEARETLFRSVRMFQALDPGSGGKYAINIAGLSSRKGRAASSVGHQNNMKNHLCHIYGRDDFLSRYILTNHSYRFLANNITHILFLLARTIQLSLQ